jgi:hypothetical protein
MQQPQMVADYVCLKTHTTVPLKAAVVALLVHRFISKLGFIADFSVRHYSRRGGQLHCYSTWDEGGAGKLRALFAC